MKTLTLNSYAKLNLYLEVLNKRPDSYHNIKAVFERISLCDKITLLLRRDKNIRVISDSPDLPVDEKKNLAYRSAKLLQDALKVDKGVDIKILKRIPVGSGLGGGSSNAAFVLLGLNKLWGLRLSKKRLIRYAQRIGCDVPFFIHGTPFALGEQRGDRIKPLRKLSKAGLWHILVVPRLKVSTPYIYEMWDKALAQRLICLTRRQSGVKILNLALRKNKDSRLGTALFNNLEEITARSYPQIKLIKKRLKNLGLESILMSGSGPAVFGVVSSGKEAQTLCAQLKRNNRSWRIFATRTI